FGGTDQRAETAGNTGLCPFQPERGFVLAQYLVDAPVKVCTAFHDAFSKADADHRITYRPVPLVMTVQPTKQRLVAREQLRQRIDEQALAEAARAGEKVMRPLLDQVQRMSGLVHIVVIVLANLGESLD